MLIIELKKHKKPKSVTKQLHQYPLSRERCIESPTTTCHYKKVLRLWCPLHWRFMSMLQGLDYITLSSSMKDDLRQNCVPLFVTANVDILFRNKMASKKNQLRDLVQPSTGDKTNVWMYIHHERHSCLQKPAVLSCSKYILAGIRISVKFCWLKLVEYHFTPFQQVPP